MLLLSEIIAPKTENIVGRNAPGPAAHLVVVQLEEGLEVVDEVGVGADQRLDDGHPGAGGGSGGGHQPQLRVRGGLGGGGGAGGGAAGQPPLATTQEG